MGAHVRMNMVSAALLLLPLLAYSLPLLSSSIDPSNPDFQYVGRWDFNNASAPAFQWAGSSISFTLQCKAASTMSASFDTHESYIKFAVYQNGETPSNYQLVEPGASTVKASIPAGKTVVTIMKTTEGLKPDPAQGSHSMLQAPCVFHGLDIDTSCTLSAAPQKERRMQFIGDSITCGFGNQVKNPLESAACLAAAAVTAPTNEIARILYEMEDVHESWGMILAREFNADAHVQCLSGIGMCKNGIGISSHSDYNMTYFVDSTLPFTAPSESNQWDYSKYQPDVIAINLGTNDYIASTGVIAPTYASFQAHYVKFVTDLMSNYDKSKTKVVLACGPMTNRQCPYVEAAATQLQKEFEIGYVNVSLTEHLGGCAGHPTAAEHSLMVDLMKPLVRKLTGWK